jgi:excisionase family DNA binding protein
MPIDPMLDEAAAAEMLGVRPQTLSVWRLTGRYSLPFCKVGRAVRYRRSDLDAFIASRTVTNTGEADSLE